MSLSGSVPRRKPRRGDRRRLSSPEARSRSQSARTGMRPARLDLRDRVPAACNPRSLPTACPSTTTTYGHRASRRNQRGGDSPPAAMRRRRRGDWKLHVDFAPARRRPACRRGRAPAVNVDHARASACAVAACACQLVRVTLRQREIRSGSAADAYRRDDPEPNPCRCLDQRHSEPVAVDRGQKIVSRAASPGRRRGVRVDVGPQRIDGRRSEISTTVAVIAGDREISIGMRRATSSPRPGRAARRGRPVRRTEGLRSNTPARAAR